jgi:hypothetical protein
MAAFDSLPPELKRALWETAYQWFSLAANGAYMDGTPGSPEARMLAARFRRAFERAQAHCAVKLQRTVARAAQLKQGDVDWRAADAHLSKHPATRRDWREYRELKIEQSGSIGIEHRLVRELETNALLELSPGAAAFLALPEGEA